MTLDSEDRFNRQLSSRKGYSFKHLWEINAPLETLWDVVSKPDNWSSIFYGLSIQKDSNEMTTLSEDARYSFQIKGSLPYTLGFKVDILKFNEKELLLVRIGGDLKGIGRFETSRHGQRTIINFKMNVVPVKCWMRLVTPIAKRFFVKNQVIQKWFSLSHTKAPHFPTALKQTKLSCGRSKG
jgi:hypothetical protein